MRMPQQRCLLKTLSIGVRRFPRWPISKLGAATHVFVNDATIEQLSSDSLHARYGRVMALRRFGPPVVESVLPLITSSQEKDFTRLAALETVRPFYSCIRANDLLAVSRALPTIHSPALKIELIKLFTLCRFVQALQVFAYVSTTTKPTSSSKSGSLSMNKNTEFRHMRMRPSSPLNETPNSELSSQQLDSLP
jgi:hypothetical protein